MKIKACFRQYSHPFFVSLSGAITKEKFFRNEFSIDDEFFLHQLYDQSMDACLESTFELYIQNMPLAYEHLTKSGIIDNIEYLFT